MYKLFQQIKKKKKAGEYSSYLEKNCRKSCHANVTEEY